MAIDTLDLTITPLSPHIGAEVRGLDLSGDYPEAAQRQLDAAYAQYGVLVFRGQDLAPPELIAFTARFGPLHIYQFGDYAHPDHPEMLILSNIKDDGGKGIGLADAGVTWHTDSSYMKEPPRGSVLYSLEIPLDDDGAPLGDTLFSSTGAAYDDLPEMTKRLLDGRLTTHSYEAKQTARMKQGIYTRKPMTPEDLAKVPPVEHPVVRTHEISGRKCLYVVPGECVGITGLPDDEAEPMLADLAERSTRPDYTYRHRWRKGDVLMWDNCLVQHLAIKDYALPQRRLMWRTTIKGGVPV